MLVENGALTAVVYIMQYLGLPIQQDGDVKAKVDNINSRVDFALFLDEDEEKKILVEIKAPSVLQCAIDKLQRGSFPLLLASHRPTDEKVIAKVRPLRLTLQAVITECVHAAMHLHGCPQSLLGRS